MFIIYSWAQDPLGTRPCVRPPARFRGCQKGSLSDHCGSNLWAGPHSEGQLGLLTVVNGQTLEHEARKTRASATTDSVEAHEALEASAVVRELSQAVQDEVHDLLA